MQKVVLAMGVEPMISASALWEGSVLDHYTKPAILVMGPVDFWHAYS